MAAPANTSGPCEPEAEAPFPALSVPWGTAQALGLLAVSILLQLILGEAGAAAAARCAPRVQGAARLGLALGGGSGATLLIVYLCLRAWAGGGAAAGRAIGLRVLGLGRALKSGAGPLLGGVAAVVACLMAQGALFRLLGFEPPEQDVVQLLRRLLADGEVEQVALLSMLAVVVVPVSEEVLFRAVPYLPLRSALGLGPAAVLASVAFAACHPYAGALAPMFVLALSLTWLMEATRTIWAPIAAHALFNGLMIAIILTGGA